MISDEMIGAARALNDKNPDFSAIWETLQKKQKPRSELAVDSLTVDPALKGLGSEVLRRRAIVSWMKSLESVGAGRFVVGRGSKQSRFRWAISPRAFIAAVAGEQPTNTTKSKPFLDEESGQGIRHEFRLRPDFVVELTLPTDLSSFEASRLAAFVQTLPFSAKEESRP